MENWGKPQESILSDEACSVHATLWAMGTIHSSAGSYFLQKASSATESTCLRKNSCSKLGHKRPNHCCRCGKLRDSYPQRLDNGKNSSRICLLWAVDTTEDIHYGRSACFRHSLTEHWTFWFWACWPQNTAHYTAQHGGLLLRVVCQALGSWLSNVEQFCSLPATTAKKHTPQTLSLYLFESIS